MCVWTKLGAHEGAHLDLVDAAVLLDPGCEHVAVPRLDGRRVHRIRFFDPFACSGEHAGTSPAARGHGGC